VFSLGPEHHGGVKSRWPAQKGALDTHRKGQGNLGHQFHLADSEGVPNQIGDDFPASGFERFHPFWRKVRLDKASIGRVFGGIHPVGYGEVP